MNLLGLDIGTTHCKAGVFRRDGALLASARQTMQVRQAASGYAYYAADELWQTTVTVMRQALSEQDGPLAAVGIAGMAETGLLVDRKTGAPRSPLIPWFDKSAASQAARLGAAGGPSTVEERFYLTGIRPTFKCSLAKILWLQDQDPAWLDGAVWLSAADYIAFRLTGSMATDYSLAGRTYAFRIDKRLWDEDWLSQFGMRAELFPPALPSGLPAGPVTWGELAGRGLAKGTPVAVAGHDHVCAAFAAGAVSGAIRTGQVLDSMGTAESLLGAYANGDLGEKEFQSGLSYGCHVARGKQYWMGGLSASGGSLEWLRSLFDSHSMSYQEIEALVASVEQQPTGILYFPYLSGSGSPHTDPQVRGAFIGLDSTHGRAELMAAVLEGTAYEMEYIRRRAEQVTGVPVDSIFTVGGGARSTQWLQIKADISGVRLSALDLPEAALLGAALVAGIGCRVYSSQRAAFASLATPEVRTFLPDEARHAAYRRLYERGYLAFQEPLRAYFQSSTS